MSPDNIQIVQLAKRGLSADEIAQALGYAVESVVFVLANNPDVNKEVPTEVAKGGFDGVSQTALNGIAALEADALAALADIVKHAEKESVRGDIAKFIVSQRLGLLKPKVEGGTTINVFDFNDRMEKVRQRRQQIEAKIVDVPSQQV